MGTKHKHAEIIKAWADGAEVQYLDMRQNDWISIVTPSFVDGMKWRIKPEPKPEVVAVALATKIDSGLYISLNGFDKSQANLKLTFDGETGELKSAEVLK